MDWNKVAPRHWLYPLTARFGWTSRRRRGTKRTYRPEIESILEQRIMPAGNLTLVPSLLALAPNSPIGVGATPDSILATHLDNSGTPYLLAANYYGNTISVLQADQ